MLLWPGLIGLVGALVTSAFRSGIKVVEYVLTGSTEGLVATARSLAPLHRLAVPVLGACLAGLILQYGMRLARGRRTTDYMEAVALGDGFISVRASLVKSASSLASIGSGASIGREGAMVQLAAMLGSVLGRLVGFPAPSRRILVSCGAAAGLASAYNAPLASAVFVSEIVLGSLELESIGPIIVSAVVANATVHQILGLAPVYDIGGFRLVSSWELLAYAFLGFLAGNLAPTYLWLLEHAQKLFQAPDLPVYLRLGLGGLVVGLLSLAAPEVWGNGYSTVNSILHQPWAWSALLLVLFAKIAATSASVGSGAVGGVFTPTLFCGAALGALVGTAAHGAYPDSTGLPADYAVVGMGAFLSGATHAPLMSILMVFEMTRQYDVVLPLMLASIIGHYVAKVQRRGKSLYSEALDVRRKPRQPHPSDLGLEHLLGSVEGTTVGPDTPRDRLLHRFAETSYNHLNVVDEEGRWHGVVDRQAAQEGAPGAVAADLIRQTSRALLVTSTLPEAMQTAAAIPSERMPVLRDLESRRFLGTLSRRDLMQAYRRHLDTRGEEPG